VQRLVEAQSDATLEELCEQLSQQRGLKVSRPTMSRLLTRLGWPRKKKSLHASERDSERGEQARAHYRELIASLEVSHLKFVDESGVNLAMARRYGRAPKGLRVVGAVPQNYGQQVTLLGAMSLAGVGAVMTVEGATDAEVFRAYVKHVLGPTLVPGDIVLL